MSLTRVHSSMVDHTLSTGMTTTLSGFCGISISDVPPGVVSMFKTAPHTWQVRGPQGQLVDTSSSTTSGLQEAINYACENGYALNVGGGGVPSTAIIPNDDSTINCTTGIVFPSMQGRTINFNWCTINFTSAVTGPGITFDSCMMVNVNFYGQIVYAGNQSAVLFKPTSTFVLDGQVGGPAEGQGGIGDCRFYIHTIAMAGGTNPTVMTLDATTFPVNNTVFEGVEWNGANIAQHGVRILTPASGLGIVGNTFRCNHLHSCSGVSLMVGSDTNAGNRIYGNHFGPIAIFPNGGSSVGCQVHGSDNTFDLAVFNNQGTVSEGVKLESSASRNLFRIARNNGTVKVNDQSSDKSNAGMHGSWRNCAHVTLANSNQTGVANETWTVVNFVDTNGWDYGSVFDNSTHRWTPGRPGIAHISARATTATTTVGTRMQLAVYKNGSLFRQSAIVTTSNVGYEGPTIAVDAIVDSATDYFDIRLWHNAGSSRDIEGGDTLTHASFHMVG